MDNEDVNLEVTDETNDDAVVVVLVEVVVGVVAVVAEDGVFLDMEEV